MSGQSTHPEPERAPEEDAPTTGSATNSATGSATDAGPNATTGTDDTAVDSAEGRRTSTAGDSSTLPGRHVIGADDDVDQKAATERGWDADEGSTTSGDASGEEVEDDDRFDRRSGWYVLRKAVREFGEDDGTDLAAGLTYYSVLSIFPAALALLSLLGIFGKGADAVQRVLNVLQPLVSAQTLDNVRGPLTALSHSEAAGATLTIGLLGALWSASGYVGAFGRAMNRIYEVDEGRPFWRLRPKNILITVVTIVLSAVAVLILVATGPVARSLGSELGVGSQAVTAWSYAKWPVLVIVVVAIIAVLYHFTPNVRLPHFRVLSAGAFTALIVWVVASALFGLYVANFSSFDRTYGSVAGVIVALLWLWITNLALVFGGEIDSEVERARELHRGLPAEEYIQLPERSRRAIERAERRRQKDIARGRAIREQRVGAGDPGDRPF